jgi:glycosyltransferase involved in cell wall biosynthesis
MLEWLKLSAASVADQEGPEIEHIIQDAGTGLEQDAWAHERPRLRYYTEPDDGMYDAINRGLKRGRGRYFGYLNCDEQYLPGTLQRVERFFLNHPKIDIVFGDVILVGQGGEPLSYRRIVRPTKVHTRLGHLGTATCATFFRRSIVERGLLFDPRWKSVGDAVWIYSLLEAGLSMSCLRVPLAIYTFTGANLSETAIGLSEMREWSMRPDAPARWLRGPAIFWHRLKKLAAGAYLPRTLRYAIYTKASPNQRVEFEARAVHFGWPGATAPAAAPLEATERIAFRRQ